MNAYSIVIPDGSKNPTIVPAGYVEFLDRSTHRYVVWGEGAVSTSRRDDALKKALKNHECVYWRDINGRKFVICI